MDKKTFTLKHLIVSIGVIIIMWMAYCEPARSQNVTVSPATGKLITALTYDQESGFAAGGSSMWKHDQLPLTFTVADEGTLTDYGSLKIHADNLHSVNGKLLLVASNSDNPDKCYITFALPKGYRFTGYKMVMTNNVTKNDISEVSHSGNMWYYYETDKTFNTSSPIKQTELGTKDTGTKEYTISRTGNEMDNILYFVFQGNKTNNDPRSAIFFQSIKLTFAADADFTTSVAPTSVSSVGASYVSTPFNTDKIDVGPIKQHKKDGATFYSYDYENVKDIQANNYLYEADCVGADGVMGSSTGVKSITSIQNGGKYYYGLKNHTYYVESPTSVNADGDVTLPVYYRITGAKVNYAVNNVSNTEFYIKYTSGTTTKYLSTDGTFAADFTKAPIWTIDTDGYIYSGTNYLGYSRSSTGAIKKYYTYKLDIKSKKDDAQKFTINSSNQIYFNGMTVNHSLFDDEYADLYLNGSNSKFDKGTDNRAAAAYKAIDGSYTLTVYGTDGGNHVFNQKVTTSGSFPLTGLNNDAVKFAVSGLPDGATAPVTVDLTMQALDPYINQINVVCHDKVNTNVTLSQQFTSDDFSIGGDNFVFYVPDENKDNSFAFTFNNLYSKYGDNTYYDGTGNGKSRYNLVNSEYYNKVNEDLYANAATVANYDYTKKVSVDNAGSKVFTFNNAADLINTSTSTKANYLKEYPFSKSAYTAEGGSFGSVELKNNDEKDYYLFTTDETRYNIAPTTSTQHRYYSMKIKLIVKSFSPTATFETIYDPTLYYNTGSSADATDKMCGLKLGTTELLDGKTGYLTVSQVNKAIAAAISAGTINKADQVLYIDASNLSSLYSTDNSKDELNELKNTLAKNAIVYLPQNETYKKDNFAYKTLSNTFKSCNNIILTDKQPFYAPYDIQLDAANYAKYTREKALSRYDDINLATLVLPFTISVSADGLHENADDKGTVLVDENKCSFTVNTMVNNSLSADLSSSQDYYAKALFTPCTEDMTVANKPYMIDVTDWSDEMNKGQFIAIQYGATIAKTESDISGDVTTGTVDGATYTFNNKGTYCGVTRPKTDNIFYFANNRYLASQNLMPANLYIYPFRAFYEYSTTGNAKAMFKYIEPVFSNDGGTTGITDVDASDNGLNITTGNGFISVTPSADTSVSIYSASGQVFDKATVKAGQCHTVSLTTGMYIVNGVKVTVR